MTRQRSRNTATTGNQRGLGKVRRSQVISTYGVGSIVPLEDESFMVAGIDRWRVGAAEEIHEPRLERKLGVNALYVPPAGGPAGDVPVVRFPTWASCPTCTRLAEHSFFCGKTENTCNRCGTKLVPSRFIAACTNGHVQDFPYFDWVHAGQTRAQEARHEMSMRSAGLSAALRDIEIECSCGVTTRTMDGAFAESALRDITRCRGSRPWLQDFEDGCAQTLRTLQRGASNVHFPIPHSAISIPPWSEEAYKLLSRAWRIVRYVGRDQLLPIFEGLLEKDWKGVDISAEEFVQLAVDRMESEVVGATGNITDDDVGFRSEEYEALCRGTEGGNERQDFVAVSAPIQGVPMDDWFDQIMVVKRLREVRALGGFTRVLPFTWGEAEERKAPLFSSDPGWLPAIEMTGEGVFLRLSEDRLKSWETRSDVNSRAESIDRNVANRSPILGIQPNQKITPRMLLVHSLSHSLINQWSLECGYPAAALRERLYVSDAMAGILIYTATTDSAGSLGGVISLAETNRLAATFVGAVQTAGWCSSDPLCIEAVAAGVDSLNLAACHACLLLPEVSCEHSNVFLDRVMLVGTADSPELGLYSNLGE